MGHYESTQTTQSTIKALHWNKINEKKDTAPQKTGIYTLQALCRIKRDRRQGLKGSIERQDRIL